MVAPSRRQQGRGPGAVHGVFSGADADPGDLKVGDKVLFGKYAGQSVKVDGDELLVIREEEILAVIQ
jgi:co-chaperonin GroES (HSP10)